MPSSSRARSFAAKVKRRAPGGTAATEDDTTQLLTVGVAATTGEALAQLKQAIRGSMWFTPRFTDAPDRGSRGIGEAPEVAVVAMPVQDAGTLADDFALSRVAVLLHGEPAAGRDADIWPARADAKEARTEAAALASQPELRDRVAHVQRRDAIARLGLVTPPTGVSMLVSTNRPQQLNTVLQNAARQVGVKGQLVLITHGFAADAGLLSAFGAENPDVAVATWEAPKEWTLGRCLNAGIERADGEDIVKMDDDNYYGANFLLDLANDLRLSGAQLTGKYAHYVHLEANGANVLRHGDREHSWAHLVQGGAMYFAGDVARAIGFSDLPRGVDSDILKRVIAEDGRVYSSDRFNFVSVRRAVPDGHTWKVTDAQILTGSGSLDFFGDPRAHATV